MTSRAALTVIRHGAALTDGLARSASYPWKGPLKKKQRSQYKAVSRPSFPPPRRSVVLFTSVAPPAGAERSPACCFEERQ